jgi:NAD-dependent SIR2 family protein deacetylase
MNRVSPVGGLAQTAEQVARWIREADRVVIGAGSGLSAAAGLDFADEADFAARFPALVRRGLKAAYQMIGYSELSEAAFWGFWSVHVAQVRFADGGSPVYEGLLRLVREKDRFVLTTNVDAMFVRNGFDPERVWSIQGDYAFLQCLRPCTTEVWPSAPPSNAPWPPSIRSRRRWRIPPAFRAASTAAATSS